MFQEPVRFIEDVIRNDRSVLDLLTATTRSSILRWHDTTACPVPPATPTHWVRVDDADQYGRGGLLPMAVFLTQNAPGLRTSPVKRGYWVVRRVLGETIPPPPPSSRSCRRTKSKIGSAAARHAGQHRANPACAACHARFDTFGLAFEGYGPVGERRDKDLGGTAGGHPSDVSRRRAGRRTGGRAGRTSAQHRQNDYMDNLSRKLLVVRAGPIADPVG